jgi:kynurenine formamidase
VFDIDLSRYRIVDLSYEVVPPGTADRPFVVERGYLADRAFKYDISNTHSHVGTHVETPAHFFEGGKSVVDLPLTWFMGRAVLLDVPEAAAASAIGPQYLKQAIGDIIQAGDSVICRNSDPDSLRSADRQRKPGFVPAGAEWLAQRNIKMLGIDQHFRLGLDVAGSRKLHHILQSQDVCLIEWLDHLDDLAQREFYFMALPWRVRTLESSWVRAIAIETR